YLVRLKTDHQRGDALKAIAEALPDDMLDEAQAAAYEMPGPLQRATGLLAVGRRRGPRERQRITGEILKLVRAIKGVTQVNILCSAALELSSAALLAEVLKVAE